MGCQHSSPKVDPQKATPASASFTSPSSRADKRRGSTQTTNLSKENSINSMDVKNRQTSLRFSAIPEFVSDGSSGSDMAHNVIEVCSNDSRAVADAVPPNPDRQLFLFQECESSSVPPSPSRTQQRAAMRYKPQPVEISVQADSWYQRPRPSLHIEVK